jgi:hypothetical protein
VEEEEEVAVTRCSDILCAPTTQENKACQKAPTPKSRHNAAAAALVRAMKARARLHLPWSVAMARAHSLVSSRVAHPTRPHSDLTAPHLGSGPPQRCRECHSAATNACERAAPINQPTDAAYSPDGRGVDAALAEARQVCAKESSARIDQDEQTNAACSASRTDVRTSCWRSYVS